MEKEFNIKGFVELYSKEENKEKALKKIKYISYIPILKKLNTAKKIVESTFTKDGKFYSNSSARYIFFALYIIELYTNIQVDLNNPLDEYDMLAQNSILNTIINNDVILDDVKEFNGFVKMFEDDLITNRCEIHSFIESVIERFSDLSTSLLPAIEKYIQQVPDMEK